MSRCQDSPIDGSRSRSKWLPKRSRERDDRPSSKSARRTQIEPGREAEAPGPSPRDMMRQLVEQGRFAFVLLDEAREHVPESETLPAWRALDEAMALVPDGPAPVVMADGLAELRARAQDRRERRPGEEALVDVPGVDRVHHVRLARPEQRPMSVPSQEVREGGPPRPGTHDGAAHQGCARGSRRRSRSSSR